MIMFALRLAIPTAEIETCLRLARPGYEAIASVSNIYSWPKEKEVAKETNQDYIFNAI
jgi:hypothetical protein